MFSNWFSGDECGHYRTSLYKRRMDQVGSRLLELRYAKDVIRQHLHEWLRFSRHIEERGLLLRPQSLIPCDNTWPSAPRGRVPTAPAFFGPPSESSSKQMNEGSFAGMSALLLVPQLGLLRF